MRKPARILCGLKEDAIDAIFSPDGKWVLTAGESNSVSFYNAETGKRVLLFKGHTTSITSMAISPTAQHIFTAARDGTSRIWRIKTGLDSLGGMGCSETPQMNGALRNEESNALPLLKDTEVQAAVFSPDGELLATLDANRTAEVWETTTGRKVTEKKGGGNQGNALIPLPSFSPDSKWIVTANSERTAVVWEAKTGIVVDEIRSTESLLSVSFSPVGKFVGTADSGRARRWEVGTGRAPVEFKGHTLPVSVMKFSQDGRWVVTGGGDTTRIWEAETGRQVGEPIRHRYPVESVAFGLDGKTVVSVSAVDMGVYVCRICVSLEELLIMSGNHVAQIFPPEEQDKYLERANL